MNADTMKAGIPKVLKREPEAFDLQFREVLDVKPLEMVGNASLALHHHMAPADGGIESAANDD